MAQRHHLARRDLFDLVDERRRVLDPLRPRVDVASLTGTLAMAPQVDRIGLHAKCRHPVGESLISPGMLPEAVQNRERDCRVRNGPGAISQPGSVGRGDEFGARYRVFRSRDGRSP